MERYFGGEELSREDIVSGLKGGIAAGDIMPVFVGAATSCAGVSLLMDSLISFMPAPSRSVSAKSLKNDADVVLDYDAKKPFAAQIYKTVADPFVGKLSIFKVLSCELTTDKSIVNSKECKPEKIGAIYVLKGKDKILSLIHILLRPALNGSLY